MRKLTTLQEEKFTQLAREAELALRKHLGDRIDIKAVRGSQGRVQMQVISDRLNELTERKKQDFLWSILNEELKEKSEWISFIIGYGTNEEIYQPLEVAK